MCLNCSCLIHLFFFNDTATTEIYTLSLHDALPISYRSVSLAAHFRAIRDAGENIFVQVAGTGPGLAAPGGAGAPPRNRGFCALPEAKASLSWLLTSARCGLRLSVFREGAPRSARRAGIAE